MNDLEKEFVPHEEALALKELGFDEPCLGFYSINNQHFKDGYFHISTENPFSTDIEPIQQELRCISAPLYQQAFRWFREKYGLWFRPDYYDEMKEYNFQGSIHKLGKYSAITNIDNYKTPEEAELACLKKLIEIVKDDNKM